MIQGRSTSINSLISSKSSSNLGSQQKFNSKVNKENTNNLSKNNSTTFQNESFFNSKNKQNSQFNSNTKDTQSFVYDKQNNSILQNSSNIIHKRSQTHLQMCYETNNNNCINTPTQQEKQRKKSQNRRQLSELEIKKMNTLNFIQALNESQRSNNNSFIYSGCGSQISSVKKPNQNVDQNIYTFSKLNEIRNQLKEQKDYLEVKQQQRDALKNYYERESNKFEQKINEIKNMIMEEEESNQNQQIIIKEEPQKRQNAIKKVFINSDKLFESLQKVDSLFQRECIQSQMITHFEDFKRQQIPILGSLEKLFQEKENIIMKIYENQDQLENFSENKKMQQQDLEGYELRNVELALEYDDLEAFIEMLKQNEDDCQILQQINLRNVWMCLQNELNKLNLKMQEVQQNYNNLDTQSRAIEKEIQQEVNQAKELISVQEQSITPKEKVGELTCKEFIKSALSDLGKTAYEEIEFLYDGKSMSTVICEESYLLESDQINIFQNKMMNLAKSFQSILIDELQSYFKKYNQLQYKGEPEQSFVNTKKQLLSNIQSEAKNSRCGQILERMLDLNSLFSRMVANCKQSELVVLLQNRITECLSIKKQSFQRDFDEQKIFCNLKYKTDEKNEQLAQIQNEKLIVMAKLDQMKNRNKELLCEIEKQEQNTIPFFTTENQSGNQGFITDRMNYGNPQTKRSNCDDSYIFDDTTGYLNKTKITQTNNQYLITALNDSHLNYTAVNNFNNNNNISQINQSSQVLNNSHITTTSFNNNNNNKQMNVLTARSNSNNQSFFNKSASKTNQNCGSQRSLSPSPSTSFINRKQGENKSQSAHYQAQYEKKNQVDKIFIRMCQIKVQKDINNRHIKEIIANSEKENSQIQQLEYQTKFQTNELLHLNGMQKDHAEKLTQIYHRFFDDKTENFIRKLESYILIQQQVPLNEFTPALNFFFTQETLTPIAKLKLLQKKMDDLKEEQENLLQNGVQQLNEIEKEIIIINQNIHHTQILYSKYDTPIEGNQSQLFYNQISGSFIPANSFQSSSSSSHALANVRGEVIHNDQSLNLSDIEGTAHKHNRTNSSLTATKQHQAFCNNNSLLQQQFGNSMFSKGTQQNYNNNNNNSSPQQNEYEGCEFAEYSNNKYASSLSYKLKIHNTLIDQSIISNILEHFKESNGGIQIYKMFQVNQGNLVKQQIFDPLTQKKHPQICGYGVRKLSLVNDELVFYNQKNLVVDLSIKIKDFTNIFIHPVTLEIIKYQTMNPNNKMLEKRSVKKFLEAVYYPFAFEVKQTGRIECLCDNYQTLKQIYTLFIAILQGQESVNTYSN